MVSFGLLLFVILNSGIWAPFLFRPQRLRIIFSTCVTAIFDPCSLAESCRCPQDCFAVGDFAAAIDASRYCADHAAPLCCCGIMSDGGHAVWIVIRHRPYKIANCEIVAVARVDPSHAIFSSDAFAACAASAVDASLQVSSSIIL